MDADLRRWEKGLSEESFALLMASLCSVNSDFFKQEHAEGCGREELRTGLPLLYFSFS